MRHGKASSGRQADLSAPPAKPRGNAHFIKLTTLPL
jgi:hypothetical protein